MALILNPSDVTHSIQLAIAPVFLLTAVAGMIGVIAGRLARIIDRARFIEDRALNHHDAAMIERARRELAQLRIRGRLANSGIALLTLCGFLIGLTIIVIFVGEAADVELGRWAIWFFLGGIGSFLLALVCFMVETILATRLLHFYIAQPTSH